MNEPIEAKQPPEVKPWVRRCRVALKTGQFCSDLASIKRTGELLVEGGFEV